MADDLSPRQPGPYQFPASVLNTLLAMAAQFRAGRRPGKVGAIGSADGIEVVRLMAAATGSGNYNSRRLISLAGGWPKACSTIDDVGDFVSSDDSIFINFPELLNSPATHYFESDSCIGLGVTLSATDGTLPVIFGIAIRLGGCDT